MGVSSLSCIYKRYSYKSIFIFFFKKKKVPLQSIQIQVFQKILIHHPIPVVDLVEVVRVVFLLALFP
jgi:hypothetical protein